ENEAKSAVKRSYEKYNYLIDPHTAVGIDSLAKYRDKTGDYTITVVDSTASPYKFSRAVLESLKNKIITKDEYRVIDELYQLTGFEIHRAIKDLEDKKIIHKRKCRKDEVKSELEDILKL
ncbi:MAG: threonine synthase, partial [Halanaerobium sp.]